MTLSDVLLWLLEGLPTAILVVFLTFWLDWRKDKRHHRNLLSMVLYELYTNYDPLVLIENKTITAQPGLFSTSVWESTKHDIARHLNSKDFFILDAAYKGLSSIDAPHNIPCPGYIRGRNEHLLHTQILTIQAFHILKKKTKSKLHLNSEEIVDKYKQPECSIKGRNNETN